MRYGFRFTAVSVLGVFVLVTCVSAMRLYCCPFAPLPHDVPESHGSGCHANQCHGEADTQSGNTPGTSRSGDHGSPLETASVQGNCCLACQSSFVLTNVDLIGYDHSGYAQLVDLMVDPAHDDFRSRLFRPPRM